MDTQGFLISVECTQFILKISNSIFKKKSKKIIYLGILNSQYNQNLKVQFVFNGFLFFQSKQLNFLKKRNIGFSFQNYKISKI